MLHHRVDADPLRHPVLVMTDAAGRIMLEGLQSLHRAQIEALAEASIALLDELDGDPDRESPGLEDDFEVPAGQMAFASGLPGCDISDPGEPLGDEEDGTTAEDDFASHRQLFNSPGCIVSDSDCGIEDGGHDEEEDGERQYLIAPIYGLDHSRGPINIEVAHRQWMASPLHT